MNVDPLAACNYAKDDEVLTDAAQFAAATGRSVSIGAAAGDAFNLFDGYVEGRQVELAPGERIVQAWRLSEWDPGVYSLVRFTLAPDGDGARLTLDQEAIPDGASPMAPTWQAHVEAGWPMFYFEPLHKYLAA